MSADQIIRLSALLCPTQISLNSFQRDCSLLSQFVKFLVVRDQFSLNVMLIAHSRVSTTLGGTIIRETS